MTRYVAFLRGINVGGHKIVRMEDLRRRFEALGFGNVSTYKASGNVRFESGDSDGKAIRTRTQRELRSIFGDEVEVLLRSVAELEGVVRLAPFRRPPHPSAVPFVTFVAKAIAAPSRLPLRSPRADIEVFRVRGRDVFSWSLPGADQRFGFPNLFVEKLFGQPATTRNWSTVTGVILPTSAPG